MAHTDFERMMVEELKSIETGATEPIAYINANRYTQHNQGVADGLAGFGAALAALKNFPEAAKVNTVRVFQDGNYVVAHTDYNFFGPKIGFDIFRFEDGKIVEHWDNLQETPKRPILPVTRRWTAPPKSKTWIRPPKTRPWPRVL
jgi:Uncharacterized protein conserved in bacteria